MPNEQYIPVGKLGKPHGTSGAFRFRLSRILKKKKLPAYFFIEQQNTSPVPFFISKFELTNAQQGLITFEEITSPEQAKKYTGCTILLTSKDATIYFEKDASGIDYLIGYQLIDQQSGKVGNIAKLIEAPAQVLAVVKGKNKEHIIPLADDFIVKIDTRHKQIQTLLPEGLLEL